MISAEGPMKTPLHPEQKSNKIEYYLLRECLYDSPCDLFFKKTLYLITFHLKKFQNCQFLVEVLFGILTTVLSLSASILFTFTLRDKLQKQVSAHFKNKLGQPVDSSQGDVKQVGECICVDSVEFFRILAKIQL